MGFKDAAFLPPSLFSTKFVQICGRGESIGATTCLNNVAAVSK